MFDFTFDEPAVLKQLKMDTARDEAKQQVIARLYAALDRRVTVRLQAELSEDDVKGFLAANEKGEEESRAWLNQRFPNARDVYQEELEALVKSLRDSADRVVDALPSEQ
jgi:hypothetical protein